MVYYLIILNIIAFLCYFLDKYFAIKNKRRISEYTLLTLSIFGGCFAALMAMYIFHHKTRKVKFILTNWIFVIIWIVLIK